MKDQLADTQKKLSKVSSTFCLAKWYHLSLHLHLGHNHSCHHPNTHKLSLNKIKKDKACLHNTVPKVKARQEMLQGKRPSECSYCWNVEDTGGVSDRIVKSSSHWAQPYLQQALTDEEKVLPKYLEVSFSHSCNLKCSYCDPRLSSAWEKEIKQHGPYLLSRIYNGTGLFSFDGKNPWPMDKVNPYVEAFWDWLPDVFPQLHVLRVTGGEPLLSRDTYKLLQYVYENKNTQLELAVNSNLCVPEKTLTNFMQQIQRFKKNKHVKKVQIFTSVDSWGAQADYTRHGLNFQTFWGNLIQFLTELPDVDVHIMSTYNILSVPQFPKLIQNFLDLKKKVQATRQGEFTLDINHLVNPKHQSVLLLPKEITLTSLQTALRTVKGCGAFNTQDLQLKIQRIADYVEQTHLEDLETYQADFYKFFTQHDMRRATNINKTFPELKEFWSYCKKKAENSPKGPSINIKHKLAWRALQAQKILTRY